MRDFVQLPIGIMMSIGIAIGIALRFLMPRRHPGGLYGTMILGLTGALFGG
ncbi:MAG: hypothetical protein JWO08_4062, partial [Verrucomicrobiaceae bacterium]|nr:hypothetical protein [Verrucomicrobiaceae bacterium]